MLSNFFKKRLSKLYKSLGPFFKAFKAKAKELKLDPEVAKELTGLWKAQAEAENGRRVEFYEASVKALQKDWGDNFEINKATAQKALRVFGTEGLVEFLEDPKHDWGTNPEVLRTFYRIGKAISEDALITGDAFDAPRVKRTAGGQPVLKYPSMEKQGGS